MPSTPDRHNSTALSQVLSEPALAIGLSEPASPFAQVLYEPPSPVQSNAAKRKREAVPLLVQPVCSACSASCNYTQVQIRALARTSGSIPRCSSCFAKVQAAVLVQPVCSACSASCNYTQVQIRGLARTPGSIPQCYSCFAKVQEAARRDSEAQKGPFHLPGWAQSVNEIEPLPLFELTESSSPLIGEPGRWDKCQYIEALTGGKDPWGKLGLGIKLASSFCRACIGRPESMPNASSQTGMDSLSCCLVSSVWLGQPGSASGRSNRTRSCTKRLVDWSTRAAASTCHEGMASIST